MRTQPPFAHAANASAENTRTRGTGISAAQRFSPDQPFNRARTGRIQSAGTGNKRQTRNTSLLGKNQAGGANRLVARDRN